MRRRAFITLLGGAAAWPLAAHAQQPALPVIGLLHPTSQNTTTNLMAEFRQALAKLAMSTVGTPQLNTAGRTANLIACRHLRPTWFVGA